MKLLWQDLYLKALQVTSLLASLPPSWLPFVTIQNNTPNQTFTKLLGKNFQESTMNQTLNNNSSKYTTLFARNKGKFNGDKNQNFHNASSSIIQLANNNKKFYKDTRCVIIVGRKATWPLFARNASMIKLMESTNPKPMMLLLHKIILPPPSPPNIIICC
jgi:hypothetical protein